MLWSKPLCLLQFILFNRWRTKLALVTLALLVAFLGLAAPLLQKIFIDTLLNRHSSVFFANLAQVLPTAVWLALGGITLFLSLSLYQLLSYLCHLEAMKTQHHISKKLYQHLLQLRPLDYQNKTTGELIAVYATDIPSSTILLEQSLPQGLNIIFPLLLTPLVLIYLFDVPAWGLLPVLFIFVLINFGMAYRQSLFFYNFKSLAAKRIGLVNEWIQNIRPLRILNWIPFFERKIFKAREIETQNRIRMLNNGQTMNALSSSMTFILTIYIIWLIRQQDPTPGQLLAIFWICSIFLTRTFRQLPWFFTFLFDAWTSISRLSEVFTLGATASSAAWPHEPRPILSQSRPPSLRVKNLNLKIHQKVILKNVNLSVTHSQMIGLIGPVAAGKSLLLLSLMGETDAEFEEYWIGDINLLTFPRQQWKSFFSYIPQDGFLMSASLRDNLNFEYDSSCENDEIIFKNLPQVEFNPQTEGLPQGLDTVIGERGLNLSGGQKQRVSLARTLIKEAPIYLFDDCLSAVDINTEKKLLANLFNQTLQTRIKILVTSRMELLTQMDQVLFLYQGQILDLDSPEFKAYIKQTEAPC